MKSMLRYTIMAFFLFAGLSQATAQDFVREVDAKTGHPLLHGRVQFSDLLKESTCNWLDQGANQYRTKANALEGVKRLHGNYRFVVFIGTWCEDTQIMLPQFLAVMRQADIPQSAVIMYGTNRNKKALNQEEITFDVQRVPTIIVLHQNREIGRITETVTNSVEEDLYAMMLADEKVLENRKAARGLQE